MIKIRILKYSHLLLLVAAILVSACTKETELGVEEQLPEGSVKIMLTNSTNSINPQAQSKAGETPPVNNNPASENYVKKIQVFIYNSASGQLECVRQYIKGDTNSEITWDGVSSAMTVNRVAKLYEEKDIYVVTNWMATLPAELKLGSNVSVLTGMITTIAAQLPLVPSDAAPLLMSGSTKKHVFHVAGIGNDKPKTATINLKRQAVKIEVKVLLDQAFAAAVQGSYTFDAGDVRLDVYNLPTKSFVMEQITPVSATGSTMLNSLGIAMLKATDTWTHTLYSYENPQMGTKPSDKLKSTYFQLNMPYKKGTDEKRNNYYRINIEDVTPSEAANPHKTLRNNHYTITVTIAGFGVEKPVFDAIHAVTKVDEWIGVNVNQEVSGKDMTINKTEVALNGNTIDESILARGTTFIDQAGLKNPIVGLTYPADMTEAMKGLQITPGILPDGKSIKIAVQNNATVAYRGPGVAAFYIQYGMFKKKITVRLHSMVILFNGIQIAKQDLPSSMDWATAMGLPIETNNTWQGWLSTETGPNQTGCNTYSEGKYGKGSGWRLPKEREPWMSTHNDIVAQGATPLRNGELYWGGEDGIGVALVYMDDYFNTYYDKYFKGDLARVRCVRDAVLFDESQVKFRLSLEINPAAKLENVPADILSIIPGSFTIPANIPTINEVTMKFDGWYTDPYCRKDKGQTYQPGDVITLSTGRLVTLYANFK